jgi:TrmH family RNA methyltransferase
VDYKCADYRSPMVLLMGNERVGLTDEQQAACDVMVQIPMLGHVDSLNVATATGIALHRFFQGEARS